MTTLCSVVVQTPSYSGMAATLSYRSEFPLSPGSLVRVPLGNRETLGIVWSIDAESALDTEAGPAIKHITGCLDQLAPLSAAWRDLVTFSARYYQRSLGEVALAALPPPLRDLDPVQLARRLKRLKVASSASNAPVDWPALSPEQAAVRERIANTEGPFLLFGATGSGKTEVYLQSVQALLQADPQAQAMVMVPEINLTPQLEQRFQQRFAPLYGDQAVVSMHSGMTPAQRLRSWLAAHSGQARIVLGTRLAIFASMPGLRLIVVDEEHDPSYKQQEGARYSARDLAVYRGRSEGAKVILGSATPSLESWHLSRPAEEGGRYQRLAMPSRIGAAQLPRTRLVDMTLQQRRTVVAPVLVQAMAERIARGEQSMVLLNRRGYAPVLHCRACDWKSQCPHCSAYRVFHKIDRSLRCHHCGFAQAVPRACPECGNIDISPLGRGTEQLEEHLAELLSAVRRPDGQAPRIARIDADSTRQKGSLEQQLAQVHSGEVDVLVGTQMIAKGHDFRRITLVAAINPDGALFSSDFRAPERLFALLMQAAGRAGRDAQHNGQAEMWIQTQHPTHALFGALRQHDYPSFARQQLLEREQAGLPPMSYQALVRAEARTQEVAQLFLSLVSEAAADLNADEQVTLYPAVPMSIARIADVERAQMLVESPSRTALQRFLSQWRELFQQVRAQPACKGLIRWAVDVDPQAI